MPAKVKAKRTSWKPGQSGNPKGRPAGKRDFITLMRRTLTDGELAVKVKEAVDRGEPWAIQACLDRYWPKSVNLEATVDHNHHIGPHLAPFTSQEMLLGARDRVIDVEVVEDEPQTIQ